MTVLVRSAIADLLKSVDGIGEVHTYERYVKAQAKFRALYEKNGTVNGWNIRRKSFQQRPFADQVQIVETRWRIEGFYALQDEQESEILFDTLIDKISATFRDNDTLNGKVVTCTLPTSAGIQLVDSGPVRFAGILCHGAELGLSAVTFDCPPELDPAYLKQIYLREELIASSEEAA